MLISYNWLKTYFKEDLPAPSELADVLTLGIFEIEGLDTHTDMHDGVETTDAVFDVKVLPDRAPYCLSHRYIAQEVSALLGIDFVLPSIEDFETTEAVDLSRNINISLSQEVLDAKACKRYVGRYIENVKVGESPVWLKKQLELLGQRSINSIVDLTNYVMLECGQPLHAFDADLVEGDIQVRFAREGESIVLLDGKTVALNPKIMVIADDVGPLAIAGIKGGKKAEVTGDTKNIILESACFKSSLIRHTSQAVGIKNDSSKRFENAVTSERAGLGMAMLTSWIAKLHKDIAGGDTLKISDAVDIHQYPDMDKVIVSHISKINQRLGLEIPKDTVAKILTSCGFGVVYDSEHEDKIMVTVPVYRSDINITEDLVDEVGRIYGYDKLDENVSNAKEGEGGAGASGEVGEKNDEHGEKIPSLSKNKNFYYHNIIRSKLSDYGFSESYTYTLVEKGLSALQNPLTVERAYLRDSISELLSKKVLPNVRNLDLLGLKKVQMFEVGKVFGQADGVDASGASATPGVMQRERYSLALVLAYTKKPKNIDLKEELKNTLDGILESVGTKVAYDAKFTEVVGDAQTPCAGMILEVDLDPIVDAQKDQVGELDIDDFKDVTFKTVSTYPFSVRDIAVFVPGENLPADDVLGVIKLSLSEDQRSLLVTSTLFDVFTKKVEGEPVKTSYAYRLVFQAEDRTLTESEVVSAMQSISDGIAKQVGWEIR
jgi:phenylalanyl-tRNA synthetase beta chain